MDWLKAASLVALGMITATRMGLGAAVGAGGLVGATVGAGAWVAGAGAWVAGAGVAAGAHAVKSMATNNNPANNIFFCFIFFSFRRII